MGGGINQRFLYAVSHRVTVNQTLFPEDNIIRNDAEKYFIMNYELWITFVPVKYVFGDCLSGQNVV